MVKQEKIRYFSTKYVAGSNREQDNTVCEIGGARRDRTVDLLHAMQALSQLSYSPKTKCE